MDSPLRWNPHRSLLGLGWVGFVATRISAGVSSFGALQYESDSKVRMWVIGSGIALPAEAYDIHYGVAGFVDKSIWIRFTVPKEKIWEVVSASIGKKETDFPSSHPKHLLSEITQDPRQSYDLSWWNPTSVASPRSWSDIEERNGQQFYEDWLIDTSTGTFYISRFDT